MAAQSRSTRLAAALAEARVRIDREVSIPCPYGNCFLGVDPLTGRIGGGFGLLGCPCDLTPGWRSSRVQGMGKPHPPVLPKGRHRSRVERSRRRHAIPEWASGAVLGAR